MGKNIHSVNNAKKMLSHGVQQGLGAFRPKMPKRQEIKINTDAKPKSEDNQ